MLKNKFRRTQRELLGFGSKNTNQHMLYVSSCDNGGSRKKKHKRINLANVMQPDDLFMNLADIVRNNINTGRWVSVIYVPPIHSRQGSVAFGLGDHTHSLKRDDNKIYDEMIEFLRERIETAKSEKVPSKGLAKHIRKLKAEGPDPSI